MEKGLNEWNSRKDTRGAFHEQLNRKVRIPDGLSTQVCTRRRAFTLRIQCLSRRARKGGEERGRDVPIPESRGWKFSIVENDAASRIYHSRHRATTTVRLYNNNYE